MECLGSYISERLNPKRLGPKDVFPINGTTDDIIEFLNRHGFEEFDTNEMLIDAFNKKNIRGYIITHLPTRIWFADTSQRKNKISEDNPLFLINDVNPTEYGVFSGKPLPAIYSKSEFLKIVNKTFNW